MTVPLKVAIDSALDRALDRSLDGNAQLRTEVERLTRDIACRPESLQLLYDIREALGYNKYFGLSLLDGAARRVKRQRDELLEALGDLVSDAETQMKNPSHHMPFSLPKARAAIAKAEAGL